MAQTRDEFIKQYGADLGGADKAGSVYDTGAGAKAAPVTGGSTPTPTPELRYSRVPTATDTSISDTQKKLDATVPASAPDQAVIREEKKKAADALITSVRTQFDRALNTSSGLGGSNFATAAAVKQEDKNAQAQALIEAERDAKINAILSDVDQRATEEYRTQRQEYIKGLEGQLDRQREAKDEDRALALKSLAGIASTGADLNQFKVADPDTYKQLQDEFGGNEFEMRAAWNEALPDDMKTKYTTQVQQGANGNAVIHRYGVNPVTGKIDDQYQDTGKSYSEFTGESGTELLYQDGTFFSKTKNADGTLTLKPVQTTPKTQSEINKNNRGTPIKSGALELTPEQASTIEQELEAARGTDKWINPDFYKETYDDWIANGGLAKDFLAKYPPKNYVNPANTTLPAYLRSPTKPATTTSTRSR